jgi:hypothetical protein
MYKLPIMELLLAIIIIALVFELQVVALPIKVGLVHQRGVAVLAWVEQQVVAIMQLEDAELKVVAVNLQLVVAFIKLDSITN